MSLKSSLIYIFVSLMALLVLSLGFFFQVLRNEKLITEGESHRYQSYLLADELRQSSDELTRMARNFVITGDPLYREYYQRIIDIRQGKLPRPEKYYSIYWDLVESTGRFPQVDAAPVALKDLTKSAGFESLELDLLNSSEDNSDTLAKLELRAMDMFDRKRIDEARRLLYGKEYSAAKEKVMRPLSQFFDTIDNRMVRNAKAHLEKRRRLGFAVVMIMSLAIVLLFLSVAIVLLYFQKEEDKKEQEVSWASFFKEGLRANAPLLMASLVAVFLTCSLAWWSLKETKSLADKNLRSHLELELNAAYGNVMDWVDQAQERVAFSASMIEQQISSAAWQEMAAGRFANFGRQLRRMGIVQGDLWDETYVVLNAKGVVAASSQKGLVGQPFTLPKDLLQAMSNPRVRLINFPTGDRQNNGLLNKNILIGANFKRGRGALLVFLPPEGKLSHLFKRGFFGLSGEVYLFNSAGRFVSENRWKDELVERGWLKSSKEPALGLRVAQQQDGGKLTLAVAEGVEGKDAQFVQQYTNYLGHPVAGLWRWDNTYRFGLATELGSDEAFGFYRSYQQQCIIGASLTVFLILILTILFVHSRMRISKVNRELTKVYETIKKQNDKFSEELEIGQKVQMDMLPDKIEGVGFELDAFLKPAQGVSGDFYDFAFADNNEKLYFCVGDVSGKGVAAALFMSMTKVSLHKTLDQTLEVKELVRRVNDELSINNANCMFVTLIVGIMDIKTGLVHITNAGHNPPYVKKRNGELICLDKTDGPLIGAFDGASFTQQSFKMSCGDCMLFYTDGVTEAQDTKEEFYEEFRMERLVKRTYFSSPGDMVRAISEDVTAFIGKASQFDDITILALEYKGTEEKPQSQPA